MSKKPFELGIIIGRFQTFHKGHEAMIKYGTQICEKVCVLVGSAQESGTLKNPFTYKMRESVLRKVFDNEIEIFPLEDIGVGNNSKWGDYVIENVHKHYGCSPDLLISGKEQRRIDWFDSVQGLSVAELYIPKTIDISATQMREHLINDDYEAWKQYTNEKLWDKYEEFKGIVSLCKDVTYTDSL